jgi:two-component SAPR family response regulator
VSEEFALKLLGQFAVHRGEEPVELPPACQRLIALVALKRRPVHRLWVCAMLWPHAQTRRAIASLRSTMWRLRPVGADPLLEIDPQYIALASAVSVDWYDSVDKIGHLLESDEPVDPQFVADLLPLLRAGELLDGWTEPWAHAERQRYRATRKAARDALGRGSEKQVATYACGSMRSMHTLHSIRKSKND